jgi:hypothetical protein
MIKARCGLREGLWKKSPFNPSLRIDLATIPFGRFDGKTALGGSGGAAQPATNISNMAQNQASGRLPDSRPIISADFGGGGI